MAKLFGVSRIWWLLVTCYTSTLIVLFGYSYVVHNAGIGQSATAWFITVGVIVSAANLIVFTVLARKICHT
jgi:hypothetical protein